MTVQVPLTRGLHALVDDADADLVMRYRWQAHRGCTTWYASRYVVVTPEVVRAELMHRLLTGWPETDHINGDGLDNRRVNLRAVTRSQNIQNSRKRRGAGSRYKGVYLYARRGHWVAQIYLFDPTRTPPKRQVRLGSFASEEAAACAYDDAARRHFGEFAALNFPRQGEQGCLRD
jgi:hypothetical protein